MEETENSFNPQRVKALAHPIRLALLEYLSSVDQGTATQCAEAINESVASCSFHLRTLAKHGFVEQAESPDAKSKPWRLSETRQTRFSYDTPDEIAQFSTLGFAVLEQFSERMREFWSAAPQLPEEAINRALFSNISLWITQEEHEELLKEIEKVLFRLRERNTHPELRPEGAKHSTYFLAATPNLRDYLDK